MSDEPALLLVACRTSDREIQRRIKLILAAAWPDRPGEVVARYISEFDEQSRSELEKILGYEATGRLLD